MFPKSITEYVPEITDILRYGRYKKYSAAKKDYLKSM